MEKSQQNNSYKRHGMRADKKHGLTMGVLTGILLIAAGIIAVLHNTGVISPYLFGIIFSWQMLLIVFGLFSALSRHYGSALLMAGVGLFFLLPKFTDMGTEWLSVYWPLLLVFAGIFIIVKLFVPTRWNHRRLAGAANRRTESGFVNIDSSLGAYEHIVIEEIFKGAAINATMSGTVLDLRHTWIDTGDTYIDINGSLAGIELYAPAEWNIVSEVKFVLGGIEDKRRFKGENIPGCRIVLRGSMTLGGIEIKS